MITQLGLAIVHISFYQY